MTLAEAVTKRTKQLLFIQNKTQYRLAKSTCLTKSAIQSMFNGRTKGVNLSTICLFAQFFGMSLKEFFDDPVFDQENLEV